MEVSNLTAKEKEDIERAFKSKLPPDSGGLSQKLARNALFMLNLNPTALEVSKCWADMDKKEDDLISLSEFECIRCKLHEDTETVMRWAFNKFDVNNDGTIDKDELKKILATVYDDEEGDLVDDEFVSACLTMADDNGDGVLQIEEFVDMIMKRTSAQRKDSVSDS